MFFKNCFYNENQKEMFISLKKLGKLKHFMVEILAYRCHVTRDIQLFYIPHEIFHSYEDIIISGNGLEYFGLCFPSVPFQQGRVFTVPHML